MEYKIDRSLLEAKSTEEILRILRTERDDYAPEAITIFEEILSQRGVSVKSGVQHARSAKTDSSAPAHTWGYDRIRNSMMDQARPPAEKGAENVLVNNPSDAVRLLNQLLDGVLNGTVDPKVAEVSTQLVMAILRAMEQEFMTESEEE
ncbi:hypothetical protein [Desulfomonile tiedjei]|uniref:Uncharacterized protein n=1 Tax=Desulfomonile tiedjei (strain ATCC 49306 / DSM 6799 / DCB-1) TaxID=706587 RepID=I4C479_DESTA|nr:hypothetical protein [Desulfomonile tiedjei]AFM24370.1 hypothetical protein Desti_1659 [Desulfomonile tiedjei DSM 6799]